MSAVWPKLDFEIGRGRILDLEPVEIFQRMFKDKLAGYLHSNHRRSVDKGIITCYTMDGLLLGL